MENKEIKIIDLEEALKRANETTSSHANGWADLAELETFNNQRCNEIKNDVIHKMNSIHGKREKKKVI